MNNQRAADVDVVLRVLMKKRLYDVRHKVLEYVGSPWRLRGWISSLRKCRHCRDVWVVGYEDCEMCGHRNSDASF